MTCGGRDPCHAQASFMEYDGIKPMRESFIRHADNAKVIKMVAATMRTVTNADDWSTKVSKVFDTAKDLAKGGMLPLVYAAMRRHEDDPEVLQELCGALKVRQRAAAECLMWSIVQYA